MQIRILRLLNNFYKSDTNREGVETDALGSYCVFGHFDALEVEEAVELQGNRVWESLVRNRLSPDAQAEKKPLQEGYVEQNVICIMREDDKSFWKRAEGRPFLFISFIDYEQDADFEKIKKELENVDIFFYLSYGHNKIIAVTCVKTYREGIEVVRKLREKFFAKKMHTLFAVQENKLDKSESDETVNCRWQGILRPGAKEKGFLQELEKGLCLTEEAPLIWYDKLGNNDVLIEADNVALKNLLRLYRMGQLMTHTNEWYKATWLNMETDIFLPEGKRAYGRGAAEAHRGTDERTAGANQGTDGRTAEVI